MSDGIDEAKVKEVLDRIRPFIQQDGGDIEYVGLDGKKVQVRLQGACAHCPSAIYTLKLGIERQVREAIPEVEEVVSV